MKIDQQAFLIAIAEARLKDSELCERSGVASATLTRIKTREGEVTPATIGRLAHALNVSVASIVKGGAAT